MENEITQSSDLGHANNLNNILKVLDDNIINENIRSLNILQREVFNYVHKWSRDYIKSLGCKIKQNIKQFYLFITGGAGVGKSDLLKTIKYVIR